MESVKNKEQYISPECEVEYVTLEGVIASSVPDFGKGGEYSW